MLRDWNDEIVARKIILIATGSEVELALKAIEPLAREGIAARVVSMPSTRSSIVRTPNIAKRVLAEGRARAWRSKRA